MPDPQNSKFDFSSIGGRAIPREEQEAYNQGVAQYNNWLFENKPDEFKAAHPLEYYYRKGYATAKQAVLAPAEKRLTGKAYADIHPKLEHLVEAGLGTYGLVKPGEPEPAIKQGVVMPEGGMAEEVEPTSVHDFSSIGGREVKNAPHGESTVNVAPDSFIRKVSAAESHVSPQVVKDYRQRIQAGEEIRPLRIEMDEHGNVVGADGRHRALAAKQEGIPQIPVQIIRRPSKFADIGGTEVESPKQIIEKQGMVYKGELTPGSGVHMLEHPDYPGKTAAIKEADITPEGVQAKMSSKLAEFGVSPEAQAPATPEPAVSK